MSDRAKLPLRSPHHRRIDGTVNVPYQLIMHSRIQGFKVDITSGTETMLTMHLTNYAQYIEPNRPSYALNSSSHNEDIMSHKRQK